MANNNVLDLALQDTFERAIEGPDVHLVRRQHGRGVEVESERDRHTDAGGGKSIMPAQLLAERAADEGREERTDIDTDVKDRIGAVAPMVARRVEAADLGRDVGLEGAIAENEREERQQEQRFECHHEMADRHQPGAKDHGAALTEEVIRKPASKEGGQINKPSIETINLRCEGLHAERAEYPPRNDGCGRLGSLMVMEFSKRWKPIWRAL